MHNSGARASIPRAHMATVMSSTKNGRPPLCVDVDGSLVSTDLLWESLISAIKIRPLVLLLVLPWLMSGRAYLKRRLAENCQFRADLLPYREAVLKYVRSEKHCGRSVWLVTAADERLAQAVSKHLGVFDGVIASDGEHNIKGAEKAAVLEQAFGLHGFSYLGNSRSDIAVWEKAASAVVVAPSESLAQKAANVTTVEKQFPVQRATGKNLLRALRLQHWSKNVLLFLPLLLAHSLRWPLIRREAMGFILFGLAASGIYIFNDLLDAQSDRQHAWKATRPFAAGLIRTGTGLALSILLLVGSMSVTWLVLGKAAAVVVVAYCALALSYSVWLKRIVLLDVFVLSSFYILRIILGGMIAPVRLSTWFMAFSGLFFLSLAIAKRHSELVHAEELVNSGLSGRGYRLGDRSFLSELGIGSAFAAIIILCLYTQSEDVRVLYSRPAFLLLMVPLLLYWTARVWLKAHRGELDEDPVVLAMKDPVSYGIGIVMLIVITFAIWR
jgi:4-hydroxybenzoate polyprenyltransferase/phosphoserine phosphatase